MHSRTMSPLGLELRYRHRSITIFTITPTSSSFTSEGHGTWHTISTVSMRHSQTADHSKLRYKAVLLAIVADRTTHLMMKQSTLSLLALAPVVLAQEWFPILTIYPDDTCSSDGHTLENVGEMPSCSYGIFLPPSPPWEVEGEIVYFYVDPSSVPEGCTAVLWSPNTATDVECSVPVLRVSSGSSRCARASHNTNNFNHGYCCGDNCDTYIPSFVPDVSANTTVNRKRQTELDGCTFNPSSDIQVRSFAPQRIVPVALCTSEDGCEYDSTETATFSYSQTWEVGAELGATILEVVQATVTFSYSEEYGEETSASVSYTVTVPNGQAGYISFTPLYECYEGSFSGDRCRAETDSEGLSPRETLNLLTVTGQVCVPKRLISGLADGTISFVPELE